MNIIVSGLSMSYLSGQPLYCFELCRELRRQGHGVTMVSEFDGELKGASGYRLKEELIKDGVNLIDIKTVKYNGIAGNYDLILASENCSKVVLEALPKVPAINIVHSEYDCETPLENSNQIIAYVCIRHSILWHIVKEHNIPQDKCVVIYNGIDRKRFRPVKKAKRDYQKIVVPCTLDTLREPFLNKVIDSANEKRKVYLFGMDCGAKLHQNEFTFISPDKFDIEADIADADEVAGILLGRVNLEAWSCGVKSTVYDPVTLESQTFEPPIDFDSKHNITNVVKQILKLTVNLDEVTIVIPHHNRVDKLKLLMDDLAGFKNVVIKRGGTFAQNNNDGFNATSTPYVLFLNDDSRINDFGIIRELVRYTRDFDIVGGVVSSGCTGFRIEDGVLVEVQNKDEHIAYPSGCCLLVKSEVFGALEGFDTNFKNGCEDIDLYLRAEAMGYKIGVNVNVVLDHKEGSSAGRYDFLNQNILFFNNRWGNKCQIKSAT